MVLKCVEPVVAGVVMAVAIVTRGRWATANHEPVSEGAVRDEQGAVFPWEGSHMTNARVGADRPL